MTITLTKPKLAFAILAVAVLAPVTALANNIFSDVPDAKFYAGPVEWASDNSITTGKTQTTFAPDDNVTRGEAVTFLKRYDDNVVQPALGTLTTDVAANVADIGTNATDIDALEGQVAALTNGAAAFVGGDLRLPITDGTDVVGKTISLTAPADGVLLITATADLQATATNAVTRCSLTTSATIMDFGYIDITDIAVNGDIASMALTRGYLVADGATTTVNLMCDAFSGSFELLDAAMTAVFAPS